MAIIELVEEGYVAQATDDADSNDVESGAGEQKEAATN